MPGRARLCCPTALESLEQPSASRSVSGKMYICTDGNIHFQMSTVGGFETRNTYGAESIHEKAQTHERDCVCANAGSEHGLQDTRGLRHRGGQSVPQERKLRGERNYKKSCIASRLFSRPLLRSLILSLKRNWDFVALRSSI